MFWKLRSSYLCFEVWDCRIYVLKFEIVVFMSWSLMSWSLRSSYLYFEVWGHHIYILKLEVVIFMFGSLRSLRSSYLCFEVWGRHIYVLKIEVVIFIFWSLRSSYLCLEVWGRHIYVLKFEVCLRSGLSVMILLVKLYCWFVLVKTSISNSMHTMRFSNNLHQVCSMPKYLKVFWSKKKQRAKIDIQNCLREENFGFINNYMSRSCLPFRSTWVHPWFLVGFVLLDL